MESVLLCKFHDRNLRNETKKRYLNYDVQNVDGEIKTLPSPVVKPSLAEDFSASMNALTRPSSSSRGKRINVDAVDVRQEFLNLQ